MRLIRSIAISKAKECYRLWMTHAIRSPGFDTVRVNGHAELYIWQGNVRGQDMTVELSLAGKMLHCYMTTPSTKGE